MANFQTQRKLRYEEKHLNSYDVFWYRNDAPDNQMVINFVYYLDKPVCAKEFMPYLERWLQEYPRYRCEVTCRWGFFYDWKPIPDFDPIKLGLVKDVQLQNCSDEGVKDFIEEVFNQPMNQPGEPKYLWRLWVLRNVPWGGCLLVYRFHHCGADGQSMAEMTRNIYFTEEEKTADEKEKEKEKPKKKARRAGLAVNWGKVFRASTAVAACAILVATRGIGAGLAAAVAVMWGKPLWRAFARVAGLELANNSAQLHGPLAGKKRTASMKMLSVAEAKAMTAEASRIAGVSEGARLTINDMLCAMVGGAFRRYLMGRGENPDKIRLGCVVPVNIRHPKAVVRCENKFSLVFARLPVHLDSVIKRMQFMHSCMEEIKDSFDVYVGIFFVKMLCFLPQTLMELAVRYYCRFASMVITNVIVNEKPVYIAGSHLKEMQFWVPSAGGIGVGVSILSYMGGITVCLVADEKQVPDLPILLRCFQEEWTDMKRVIPAPASPISPSTDGGMSSPVSS